MAIKRRDGQIWIDKNNTHRLKYHIDNTTYEVATSQTFASNDIPSVEKGQLVVSTGGTLAKAVWPDDAERVLGIVTTTENIENSKYVTSISSSGRIILSAEEMGSCFVDGAALPVSTGDNSWATTEKKGIGCPVYWFIGLSKSENEYIDSTDKPGMLTFSTPSGFKYGVTSVKKEQFNISYDNLPIVGHIVDYSYSGDSFTELVIDLQVATYTPVVTWNYPGIHGSASGHKCGTLENGDHKFYHGLFADNRKNNICMCNLAIRAISASETYPEGTDAAEYTVVAPYKNVIKEENNRYTQISISSIEKLRYRITGTVHYNIDRSSN